MKKSLSFILCAGVLAGCATDRSDSSRQVSETLAISRATLKSYGTLALSATTERTPTFTFFTPHAKHEAAEAIMNGLFASRSSGETAPPANSTGPALPLTGVSATEIARATNTIRKILADSPLQPGFNARIVALAQSNHQATILIHSPATKADTLITVKQFSHGLLRAEGTNPPIVFHGSLLVTAHRQRDGELLAVVPLDYRSPPHRLGEWTARDATLFRAELETFRQRCAATIVHWLYDGRD